MATISQPTEDLELEDLLSAREELEQIAEALREADEAEKTAETLKKELRGPFLDLISEVVRDEVPLAKRNETVTAEELERCGGDFETWRVRNFPEWNLVGITSVASTQKQTKGQKRTPKLGEGADSVVTLEESDQYKKYSFVLNGHKYGRTFKLVGGEFRAQAFKEEVAKREDISRDLLFQLLDTVKTETVTVYTLDEDKARELMSEHPETMNVFQEYTSPGKLQVSLLPIKAVKETEE